MMLAIAARETSAENGNRPHLTPSIRLARNPKRVIVQWVGIWNKQYIYFMLFSYMFRTFYASLHIGTNHAFTPPIKQLGPIGNFYS